jgi:hypothetical protein
MSEPSQATAHGWCIADREVQKRVGPRVAGSPPQHIRVPQSLLPLPDLVARTIPWLRGSRWVLPKGGSLERTAFALIALASPAGLARRASARRQDSWVKSVYTVLQVFSRDLVGGA